MLVKLISTAVPYLLLVSFSSGEINDFGVNKINALKASPYHGVAVKLTDKEKMTKSFVENTNDRIEFLKSRTNKDIWPWIFLDIIVGINQKNDHNSNKSNKTTPKIIKGIDLYNEAGALRELYDLWALSLKVSKELGAPGIVVDHEFYSNREASKLSYLSKLTGRTKKNIIKRLREIGEKLMFITEEEFPEATIWFLATGLISTINEPQNLYEIEYKLSVSYIIQGMLSSVKKNNSKIIIVAGGESHPWGYCYESRQVLRKKINYRYRMFKKYRDLYPNLYLGGTIAPWAHTEEKRSWLVKRKECREAPQKTIGDFAPYFDLIMQSFSYVWIYGASAAGYDPYNPLVYHRFNKVIGDSLQSAMVKPLLKQPSLWIQPSKRLQENPN